jgi:hypothetical protein
MENGEYIQLLILWFVVISYIDPAGDSVSGIVGSISQSIGFVLMYTIPIGFILLLLIQRTNN